MRNGLPVFTWLLNSIHDWHKREVHRRVVFIMGQIWPSSRRSQAGAECWGGQRPPWYLRGEMGSSPSSHQGREPRPTWGPGSATAQSFLGEQSGLGTGGQAATSHPCLCPSSEFQHQRGGFISCASILNKQDHDEVWWPQGPNGLSVGVSGTWVISQERVLGRLPGAEFTLWFSALLFSFPPPSSILEFLAYLPP